MGMKLKLTLAAIAAVLVAAIVGWPPLAAQAPARAAAGSAVAVDADDLGGVVTGVQGPEAGVWVIAETADFSTKMRKIVVTGDMGRFVIPDMPAANYDVWVRGYGLVDSAKVKAR